MSDVLHWLLVHWLTIATIAGAWAAVASVINKTLWPKPKPPAAQWKVVLHALLIDGPAFLPSVDCKGLFGAPFNIPFFTLSTVPLKDEIPPGTILKGGKVNLLLPIAFLAALSVGISGCKTKVTAHQVIVDIGDIAKECLAPPIINEVIRVIPRVVVALLGDYMTGLTALVQQLISDGLHAGPLIVSCAVDIVRQNASGAHAAAALGEMQVRLVGNARAWLAAHPIGGVL